MGLTELVPLVALLVKGVTLTAAALIIVAFLKRRAASVRHLICALFLAGLLLLPLLSLLPLGLPVWQVPLRASAVAIPTVPTAPRATMAQPTTSTPTTPPIAATEMVAPVTVATTVTTETVNVWPLLVLAIYGAGVLVALGAMLRDYRAAHDLHRTSQPAEADLSATVTAAAVPLGVRRKIAVRCGNGVGVPMTMGLLHPTILLPSHALHWEPERLHVAILHEVAHIRRGDFAWQMIARLACALHWCNPLCWLLARRMREEAERACDDRVLSAGIVASNYADHLVAVARNLAGQHPVPALAVSMARQSNLGRRLTALLAARMDRRNLSLPHGLVLATAITLVLLPLAALRSRLIAQSEPEETTKASLQQPRPTPKPGVFRHTLADGTKVELVSVIYWPPSGKPRLWRPDGTPLSGPVPYRREHDGNPPGLYAQIKEQNWEFLLRLSGPGREGRGQLLKPITPSDERTTFAGCTAPDGRRYLPELTVIRLRLPETTRTASFRFGVTPAKWQETSMRTEMWDIGGTGGGTTAAGQHIDQVTYGRPVITRLDPHNAGNPPQLGTFRHVTHSVITDEETRWVAETMSGKTVPVDEMSPLQTDGLMSQDLFIAGLRPQQIKEIRMESRSYDWMEFANIVLPDTK